MSKFLKKVLVSSIAECVLGMEMSDKEKRKQELIRQMEQKAIRQKEAEVMRRKQEELMQSLLGKFIHMDPDDPESEWKMAEEVDELIRLPHFNINHHCYMILNNTGYNIIIFLMQRIMNDAAIFQMPAHSFDWRYDILMNLLESGPDRLFLGIVTGRNGHSKNRKVIVKKKRTKVLDPLHVLNQEPTSSLIWSYLPPSLPCAINVNDQDKDKKTMLMWAIDLGVHDVAKKLIQSPSYKFTEPLDINQKDRYGNTVLAYAINKGDVKTTSLLLAEDASRWKEKLDVNFFNSENIPVLCMPFVTRSGFPGEESRPDFVTNSFCNKDMVDVTQRQLIELLLKADRDGDKFLSPLYINALDADNVSVLHHAIKRDNVELVEFLLSPDTDLKQKWNQAILDCGLFLGIVNEGRYASNILQLLLNMENVKYDFNSKIRHYLYTTDIRGQMYIAFADHPKINLQKLTTQHDETVLQTAISRNNVEALGLLLKVHNDRITEKIDLNITDSTGRSLLHMAIENKNVDAVKMLLHAKGNQFKGKLDVNIKAKNVKYVRSEHLVYIAEQNKITSSKEHKFGKAPGKTPLQLAVETNEPQMVKIVKLLLNHDQRDFLSPISIDGLVLTAKQQKEFKNALEKSQKPLKESRQNNDKKKDKQNDKQKGKQKKHKKKNKESSSSAD